MKQIQGFGKAEEEEGRTNRAKRKRTARRASDDGLRGPPTPEQKEITIGLDLS